MKELARRHCKLLPAQKTIAAQTTRAAHSPSSRHQVLLELLLHSFTRFPLLADINEAKPQHFNNLLPKLLHNSGEGEKKLLNAIIKLKVSDDCSLNYLLSVKLKLKRLRRMQANCVTELG